MFLREKHPFKKIDGKHYITAPSLIEYGKKYFNCSKIIGIALEDEVYIKKKKKNQKNKTKTKKGWKWNRRRTLGKKNFRK